MQTLASVTEPKVGSDSEGVLVAETPPVARVYSVIPLPPGAITLSPFRTTNPDVLRRGTAETT
jgi:hypothetical protein